MSWHATQFQRKTRKREVISGIRSSQSSSRQACRHPVHRAGRLGSGGGKCCSASAQPCISSPWTANTKKIQKRKWETHTWLEAEKKTERKGSPDWCQCWGARRPNIPCISKGRTCNRRGQLAWADRSSACPSTQNKGICYWWPSGMQHLWLVSCCRPDGDEFKERCCPKRSQLSPEYQYDCVWDWCSTQSSVSLSIQAWIPVWKKRD